MAALATIATLAPHAAQLVSAHGRLSAAPRPLLQPGSGVAVAAIHWKPSTGAIARVRAAAAGHGASAPSAFQLITDEDTEDVGLSADWAETVSVINYEDLCAHLLSRSRPYHANTIPAEPEGVLNTDEGDESAASPAQLDERYGVVSGEWADNISILSYKDLSTYFKNKKQLFRKRAQPDSIISSVMSRNLRTAHTDDIVGDISHYFAEVSGVPVLDRDTGLCVGILSKKDVAAKSASADTKVSDIMSSPAVTLRPETDVLSATVLMLKNKIHRLPVVDSKGQLVGMVTRTDIFTALEGK